jgi:hypothetical protein
MDFGYMDLTSRVQVYDAMGGKPVSIMVNIVNSRLSRMWKWILVTDPLWSGRIYIEIEQFNPPDEPHIHVREVLFKE